MVFTVFTVFSVLECSSMLTLCAEIESAHIRVIFFSFKIEETYTLTTFVDHTLSFSVYSKSTYDSLVWLGFFDLSKLFKNISDLLVI